jgi:hypothetical protein
MKFHCWLQGDHVESDGLEVDAFDPSEAAQEACVAWNDRGAWAGDPFPNTIDVYVRDVSTRELVTVAVSPSWDISFYGDDPEPAAEPE